MWWAFVVDGGADELRRFVDAWIARRPAEAASIVLGSDVGLAVAAEHTLLIDDAVVAATHDALAGRFRVVDGRPIGDVWLDFVAEAGSRAAAASVRAVIGTLAGGVRLQQHAEHEEEHVVAHDAGRSRRYAYRASGTLAGPLAAVLDVRRRLLGTGVARPGALRVD